VRVLPTFASLIPPLTLFASLSVLPTEAKLQGKKATTAGGKKTVERCVKGFSEVAYWALELSILSLRRSKPERQEHASTDFYP
jgi:hypothetical protein